jgi:hypothetical protein
VYHRKCRQCAWSFQYGNNKTCTLNRLEWYTMTMHRILDLSWIYINYGNTMLQLPIAKVTVILITACNLIPKSSVTMPLHLDGIRYFCLTDDTRKDSPWYVTLWGRLGTRCKFLYREGKKEARRRAFIAKGINTLNESLI